MRIQKMRGILSDWLNKILSPNAPNENERIRRRRLMKLRLRAFGEDGEGQKVEHISANFRTKKWNKGLERPKHHLIS